MSAALFAPQNLEQQQTQNSTTGAIRSDEIPGMKEAVQDRLRNRLAASGAIQDTSPAEPIVVQDPVASAAAVEEVEEPIVSVTTDAVPADPQDPQASTAENFRKLRTTLKETKRTAADLLEQKTQYETKVKQYESGEVLTEETKKLRERISQLEPLEHLINLKKSDGYAHKVSTLGTKTDTLKALAKDYEIPEELIERASHVTNKRELNTFLDQHFDGVGALQAAQIIGEIQGVRGELKSAEDAPRQALEKLNQEHLALRDHEEAKRRNQIVDTGKTSWMSALLDLRAEGKYQEIIPRENDPEFNSTWVEPITKKAGEQYSSLLTALGQDGIQKLDPEVGKGIAKMVLKAVGHDTAVARANAAERALEELQKNTQRENHMVRPRLNGSGGVPPAPTGKQSKGPTGAARAMLSDLAGVKF